MCQSKLYARYEFMMYVQPARRTLKKTSVPRSTVAVLHWKTKTKKKERELVTQKDSFDGNDLIMREFVRNKS